MTESTDPIPGEHVVAAIPMDQRDDDSARPRSPGHRHTAGVVKRWNREAPTTMDSWSVIDLKDGDSVLFAADAADEDRLVFIASDSSLLTFDAGNVRPQGRTAGGMAGIRLAEGCTAITFNGARRQDRVDVRRGRQRHVLRVRSRRADGRRRQGRAARHRKRCGQGDAVGDVPDQAPRHRRSEVAAFPGRQNTLIFARVGMYPLHASTEGGSPVELPKPDMRRDASGVDLAAPVAFCG